MISEKSWSLEAVARLYLGVILTLIAGSLLAGAFEFTHYSKDRKQFLEIIVSVLFSQGGVLVWVALFLRKSNISWREAFGLRPASRVRAVAWGLAAGILFVPAAWLLQLVSQFVMELMKLKLVAQAAVDEVQNSARSVPEKILFAAFALLLAPLVEEIIFRGILYPAIKQTGHPRLALWLTSIIFGVMHFNLVSLMPLVVFGAFLALLYEATGSLLTPIATHAMFNSVNYIYLVFQDPINRVLHIHERI